MENIREDPEILLTSKAWYFMDKIINCKKLKWLCCIVCLDSKLRIKAHHCRTADVFITVKSSLGCWDVSIRLIRSTDQKLKFWYCYCIRSGIVWPFWGHCFSNLASSCLYSWISGVLQLIPLAPFWFKPTTVDCSWARAQISSLLRDTVVCEWTIITLTHPLARWWYCCHHEARYCLDKLTQIEMWV